ncbi:protein LIKE COV 3 [Artemisia annua]|uniref:Protein LIKE COV 3 n=1 Tax=Artemisia annua TaxID=35608 RepID=A0A2U1P7V8_ARTAN|nr:protein LIKE COV 3 [Artemisia annua]
MPEAGSQSELECEIKALRKMGSRDKDNKDLQRLIPLKALGLPDQTNGDSRSSSPGDSPLGAPSSARKAGKEESGMAHVVLQLWVMWIFRKFDNLALVKVIHSWASKKFMSGWETANTRTIYIHRNDTRIYLLGIPHMLCLLSFTGLGFVTSITFIFLVGVFMSSWLGANLLTLGEFIIKKLPFMSYIYTASKQISVAISPGQGSNAFKEVAIIKHPSVGEYAIGFITSTLVLCKNSGDEELCCIYVPTNHLYMGDIVLVNSKDVMRPNISVREGIEIVISGGMSIPKLLTTTNSQDLHSTRVGKYVIPQV